MKLPVLVLILILSSCASQKTKEKSIDEITNEDFKPVKVVRYTRSDDSLKNIKAVLSEQLNKESLQRVYKYDGEFKVDSLLDQLVAFWHQKEFKKAKDLVRTHSRKFIKNPIFWNQVGSCFVLEKDYRKALLFFNRALSIKGNYAPALNNLGIMYLRKRDFSRALVAFKRARKENRFSKTPNFNLASLYLQFGQYELALSSLKPLASSSTTDVDVLNMVGTGFLMKNDAKQAVSWFEKIPTEFLEKDHFGINYALALYQSGQNKKAKDIWEDIDVSQHYSEYYKLVGRHIGGRK